MAPRVGRLCVAGRWRVRRSRRRGTAGSGASPTLVFSCTGRIACGAPGGSQIRALGRAPRQGTDQIRRSAGDRGRIPCSATERHGPHAKMTLSLAVSCRWRQSRRGGRGSTAPVSEPARPGEPGPGSRRPQRAAGQRARCQRGQPGKRALYAGGAAAGIDPWLPQPVLAVLVSVLDQRQGRHLLVLE